jgi:hypothetical protein
MKPLFITIIFIIFLNSCGIYTFSGKSIPPDVKNAQLLLFEDNTGRYDLNLPETLNEKIIKNIVDYNFFDLENSSDADSRIYGSVRSYTEKITSQSRSENADQMEIIVSVELNFFNNRSDEFIVKNLTITEKEYYQSSQGDSGRDEALKKLTDRLSENIVLGLSSNW